MKKTLIGLAATTLVVAGIWSAQPANADCTSQCDQQFLSRMDGQGISGAYGGGDRVVHIAHNICTRLAAGASSDQVLAEVEQGNPSLTPVQAQYLVASAQYIYCS
jgi:Protein of unknown function (DUF732)